jgi:hypothetical protein
LGFWKDNPRIGSAVATSAQVRHCAFVLFAKPFIIALDVRLKLSAQDRIDVQRPSEWESFFNRALQKDRMEVHDLLALEVLLPSADSAFERTKLLKAQHFKGHQALHAANAVRAVDDDIVVGVEFGFGASLKLAQRDQLAAFDAAFFKLFWLANVDKRDLAYALLKLRRSDDPFGLVRHV